MLWLAVVRSPHAHARIARIDGSDAARIPGVAAVLTRAELPALAGSVPPLVPAPEFHRYHHPVLAAGRVAYAGEAVAVVVADTAYIAADAVERVSVEYEPLTAAATVEAALATGAPKVHEGWPGNLAGVSESAHGQRRRRLRQGRRRRGDASSTTRASRACRSSRAPCWPSHDPATGLLTVWLSTQVPFAVRSAIAAVLGMAEEHVRVIAPEVGGGFGVKGHVYPEDILVPAVARHLGRPVKWIETRREHFLTAAADRDQAHRARLGVTEGRRHRGPRDGVHAGSRRAHDARRGHHLQHDQPPGRPLPRSQLPRRGAQRRHPQDLRRRVSRRGTPRGQLRPGSPARPRRAADRHGPGRSAAKESRAPRRDAVADGVDLPRRRAHRLRPGRLREDVRPHAREARLRGLARRAGEAPRDVTPDRARDLRLRRGHRHRALRGRQCPRRPERHRLRGHRRVLAGPGPRDYLGADLRRRPLGAASSRW